MHFREITVEDYDRLMPFWKENYFVNDHDSLDRFRLFLEKNPALSILAEDNGIIVGTALGSFDGRRGYIQKLVVAKTYRRKGLGKQLVENIMKKLQGLGCTYIPLAVEKDLVDFYKKCGFKSSGQIAMNIHM